MLAEVWKTLMKGIWHHSQGPGVRRKGALLPPWPSPEVSILPSFTPSLHLQKVQGETLLPCLQWSRKYKKELWVLNGKRNSSSPADHNVLAQLQSFCTAGSLHFLTLIKNSLNTKLLHKKRDCVPLSQWTFNQYYGVYVLMKEIDF